MKAFWTAHRGGFQWGLVGLLALWVLWYARPMDFCDLMGGETPEHLVITVWPQKEFPRLLQGNLSLTPGGPEMDTVLERLEELRFHRNPLEVLLQFLPEGTRSTTVDPEKDYRIYFTGFDKEGQLLQELRFDIVGWWRRSSLERDLPLYISHGQEKGRELGAFLWEMSLSQEEAA